LSNHNRTHSSSNAAGNRLPDELLRRHFGDLRREEEQHAPEFAAMWPALLRSRRHSARWLLAATCALIALGGALLIRPFPHAPTRSTVASITEWKAPTDFLLETPEREFLRTVPEIGSWRGYLPAPVRVPGASAHGKTSSALKRRK
jgi:hypothetical protein